MKRFSWTTLAARLATAAVLFVVANVAQATPIALSTPGGLNAGDKFRFLAVTSSATNVFSTDINTYNTFVQNAFGGATYDTVTVNWKAVGSTAGSSARDNVGGYGTSVGVYLPTGTKLADSLKTTGNGLWSGSLLTAPNRFIDGTVSSHELWTGSNADGTSSLFALGFGGGTLTGNDNFGNGMWLNFSIGMFPNQTKYMYGLSEELTVAGSPVPEIDPAGMGSVLALVSGALGLLERRRRQTP